jgi:DNA primase
MDAIDFSTIRATHPLASFCESRGIALHRGGSADRMVALCPLHNEMTPSFTLYPDDRYYCYGCGAAGDVVDLCAALDGINLRDASDKLSAGSSLTPASEVPRATSIPAEPYQLRTPDIALMSAAAHRLASDNDKIHEFCKERPEWSYEALWHAAIEGDLGIDGDSILFGYTHGIKERSKDSNGNRVFKWLCGGACGQCWRQGSLTSNHRRVFITEGETDALTMLSMGFENDCSNLVLGLAGAEVLPKPEPFRGRDIIIIPDPDEAGRKCAHKLRALLEPFARRIVTVNLENLYNG